jgi:hypothetical protein
MKKILVLFSLICCISFCQNAYGQVNYGFLAGLKMGIPAGLNVKAMLDGDVIAIEGVVGFDFNNNVNTTLLFEYHGYLTRVSNWYAGLGSTLITGETFTQGFDGIIGAEITFENYPLNASLDWKPSFRLNTKKMELVQFGLGIRYVLY